MSTIPNPEDIEDRRVHQSRIAPTQIAFIKKYGLVIRGFKGQHLLVDPNIQKKIIKTLDPKPKEWILEIGPGLGALTQELLAAGARVIAVEKDKRFCEVLEQELGTEYKRKLRIESADILETNLKQLLTPHPSLSPQGERVRVRGVKVVSNLPYYITSPVLFWLIANRAWVKNAVLMMQREVARRLLAQPGDKDYGRLTLALRYYTEVRHAFDVSRNCFTPKPDVDSTVLTLNFHPPSRFPKEIDENFLFHIIQTAFSARRKTLLNRLASDAQIKKSRSELEAVLAHLGIPENARAENLLLKDFISLAECLKS